MQSGSSNNNFNKRLSYLYTLIAIILIWLVLSVTTSLPFIPNPFNVGLNITDIFLSKLVVHLFYSLWRIFVSILISVVIGVPLGLGAGYYNRLDRFIAPASYFLYPIPKIALLPVVMLIFGLGEVSKIIMITMIIFFQILVSARDTVKGIPDETYYSLLSLGAGTFDIFKRIIIPASFPGLLTSIRVSLGTALSVLFFTETFGTEYGLGFFIMDSWVRVNYVEMYSGIVMLSVTGLFLFLMVDVVEKVVCRWKK